MRDGIAGKEALSNFVLLDLRFIILIAEQYHNNTERKKKRNKSNHITKGGEV